MSLRQLLVGKELPLLHIIRMPDCEAYGPGEQVFFYADLQKLRSFGMDIFDRQHLPPPILGVD